MFVEEELRRVTMEWDDQKEKDMGPVLTKSIPDMSLVFGGSMTKWPEPEGFSPKQLRKTYVMFLQYFFCEIMCKERTRCR